MNKVKKEKKPQTEKDFLYKYSTYVRSGPGALGLTLIMTLVYVIKFFLGRNFNFWFSLSCVECLLRSSGLFGIGKGEINNAAALLLAAACLGVFITATVLSMKDHRLNVLSLILYSADFGILIWSIVSCHYRPFDKSSLIDVVIHVMILIFIAVSIYGYRVLKKNGKDVVDIYEDKRKKKKKSSEQ